MTTVPVCESFVRNLTDSSAVVEALPYLDKVLHESLRFDMPVPGTVRQAQRDAVIPLSKPVQGRDGKMMDTVSVQKGQDIFLR